MRTICLTVDLDRDANIPSGDSLQACSADRGSGTEPRFSSSRKGTELLVGLLDEMGVKATFFAEARTLKETDASDMLTGHEIALHGLDHEDFTGGSCGIKMDDDEIRDVLAKGKDMIKDLSGKYPRGFRAPYMRFDPSKYHILEDIGMKYDSSVYAEINERMIPYSIGGITEFPVPQGTDANGKRMMAYLWPMHEGKRGPEDYIRMAMRMKEGVFVLATHTWHMAETVAGGPMDEGQIETNMDNLCRTVEALTDDGFGFETMGSLAHIFRKL